MRSANVSPFVAGLWLKERAVKSSSFSLTRQALLVALLGAGIGVSVAATPKEQQAIVQTGNGGPEVLKLQTVAVLEPGVGQVLIRVYAAAVNPTDWKTRIGAPGSAAVTGAIVPGGDVAGVIEKIGSGVDTLKVGDPVFAVISRSNGVLNGGYSQYAVAAIANVVPKPPGATYAEAAGLGIATITGVRAVDETKVSQGERVLITGVAGGVGSAAAQAAKARGAYVIGTATAQHNAYLKSIGVDEVIDYTQGKFEDKVKNVDVVIDTVGSDTAERALTTIKKGGLYVSVAAHDLEDKCAAAGVNCMSRNAVPGQQKGLYEEVSTLATTGKLKVKVEKTFPLAQAAQAQELGEQGHTEGKIVLIVNEAKANRK
jgi:NADPH:quinone reductase-like Zn-dependent oxidoreductase